VRVRSANNASKHASNSQSGPQALSGVTVLEIASAPGACFTASLLADFNASVYVCESLPDGSAMRALEPREWWAIAARNKKSVALDPAAAGADEAIRALLSMAQVIVTDIAPADRGKHPWLRAVDGLLRKPLLVDVIPTGADRPDLWPWSKRADMAAATTGMMALTGDAGSMPVQPEFPLAEYLSGALAALRAVAELRRAGVTHSRPEELVVPMHQAVNRMIEWQVPIATAMGRPELRDGNTFPMNFSISNMFLTGDGKYIAVSAANDASAAKLLEMIGGASLRDDPRFSTAQARLQGLHEIYAVLDQWIGARTCAEVNATAEKAGVVVGQIYDADDIARDAHLEARGNIIEARAAYGARVLMPGIIPRVAGWNVAVRHPGPALGADTVEALAACGLVAAAIDRLRRAGAIL
jgi:crotonobetainyl-CoA:carnitine CoA-transferase CaiB-like acyl-CoA transferase